MIPTHTVPSLSGTLAKRTKPMLKPNFAKEPSSPSHPNAMTKKHCGKIETFELKEENSQHITKAVKNRLNSNNIKVYSPF